MLRMIGYGENLGSGFPLILSAWNEKHWLKPELVEYPELMKVKLILHIETKNVVKDVAKEISDRQHIILGFLQDPPTLSATELSQKTGMTLRTIQRDMAGIILYLLNRIIQ